MAVVPSVVGLVGSAPIVQTAHCFKTLDPDGAIRAPSYCSVSLVPHLVERELANPQTVSPLTKNGEAGNAAPFS